QRTAAGCGLMTIAQRAFSEINTLYIAVDVGLVEGTTAATTPNGSAISMTFLSSIRLTTPTVRIGRMKSYTWHELNRFFSILSATTPYPVSSTASRASVSACGVTAFAIAVTMASI